MNDTKYRDRRLGDEAKRILHTSTQPQKDGGLNYSRLVEVISVLCGVSRRSTFCCRAARIILNCVISGGTVRLLNVKNALVCKADNC